MFKSKIEANKRRSEKIKMEPWYLEPEQEDRNEHINHQSTCHQKKETKQKLLWVQQNSKSYKNQYQSSYILSTTDTNWRGNTKHSPKKCKDERSLTQN